jgi:hypothetical protein
MKKLKKSKKIPNLIILILILCYFSPYIIFRKFAPILPWKYIVVHQAVSSNGATEEIILAGEEQHQYILKPGFIKTIVCEFFLKPVSILDKSLSGRYFMLR